VKQLEATCKELEQKLEDAGAMRLALEASKSELARNLSELELQVDERALEKKNSENKKKIY
jgi:phage shock protein A